MTRSTELGTFALRELDEDGPATDDGRNITGIAVPYAARVRGATREYGGAGETFAPGSFRDAIAAVRAGARVPILDRHDGNVVGYADELADTPAGLAFAGRLLGSAAARDFAERIVAGIAGVSIEFLPGEIRRARDMVEHTRVRVLGAIAGAYAPAYSGALAAIRDLEGNTAMDDPIITPAVETPDTAAALVALTPAQVQSLATDAADEAFRRYAERSAGVTRPVDPWNDVRAYRSLGELMVAAAQPDAPLSLRSYAARTIADQLTTDSNAGVLTPGVLANVSGIVSRGRRAITAFGGPRPLGGSGMSVDWPYFDGTLSSLVGVQSTEKTDVTSVKVEIKKGTEAIRTFAGGSDISYQLIRRSAPAYLDIYGRILLTAWAVVTDVNMVTELESGSVTVDFTEALASVDAADLKGLVIDASIVVETATGLPAEFVLASTTAFTHAAKLLTPASSQPDGAAAGVVDIAALRVNIGNLPIIHVPSITAGKFIASNREAAGWFEDGPFQASDEDSLKLGRNVAYWSLGVPARFIPGGIVEIYDVTP